MASSRQSSQLVVHSRWDAAEPEGSPPVVYAVEPARRRIALWGPPVVAVIALLAWGLGVPGIVSAVVAGLLVMALVTWSVLGRTGFYQLSCDGRGDFLGRRVPDLSGMRRTRVRGAEAVDPR